MAQEEEYNVFFLFRTDLMDICHRTDKFVEGIHYARCTTKLFVLRISFRNLFSVNRIFISYNRHELFENATKLDLSRNLRTNSKRFAIRFDTYQRLAASQVSGFSYHTHLTTKSSSQFNIVTSCSFYYHSIYSLFIY